MTTDKKEIETASNDVVTISIISPIKRNGENLTELKLRKPRAGQMRGLKTGDLMTGDVNSVIVILSRISEPVLVADEIENMDPSDFAECCGVIRDFFMSPDERKTMETLIRGT